MLRGDWLTTGPQVDAFEADLAEVTGGVGVATVSNGTAALHVAYAAAGVGPGDEVVVPPMTFVATASSAVALGAKIVFADVEEDTFSLDPAAAADAAITARTKVVAGCRLRRPPRRLRRAAQVASRAATRCCSPTPRTRSAARTTAGRSDRSPT